MYAQEKLLLLLSTIISSLPEESEEIFPTSKLVCVCVCVFCSSNTLTYVSAVIK